LGRAGLPKWVRLGSTVARQVGEIGREAKLLERGASRSWCRIGRLVARRDWSRGLAGGGEDLGGLTTRCS
jgi:hypothetical protein